MAVVIISVLAVIILLWSGVLDSFLYKDTKTVQKTNQNNINRQKPKNYETGNYHSRTLTKKEKAIIILGMLYIAYEDDRKVDEQEKFSIEFNSALLGMSLEEYDNIIDDLKVVDDKELFAQLKNLSLENKKFVVRAFHSVANTSSFAFHRKAPIMFQILEEMDVDIERIMDYL